MEFELVAAPHSHAAAGRAAELAREGRVDAIMKGSLHTDELMAAALDPAMGLRTERRMSHVFAIDAPHYPKPLFITDAAINIYPDLETKRDIVQNAIDLARALRIDPPKVAILSAVETVTPKIPSTVDAAALCKMAERGQITGGILDGPLAFDNAVSKEAARAKGIVSAVAGDADILVAPDLEAGNMLAKQLVYLGRRRHCGARARSACPYHADEPGRRRALAARLCGSRADFCALASERRVAKGRGESCDSRRDPAQLITRSGALDLRRSSQRAKEKRLHVRRGNMKALFCGAGAEIKPRCVRRLPRARAARSRDPRRSRCSCGLRWRWRAFSVACR